MKQDFYLQPDGQDDEIKTPPNGDTGGETPPIDDEESDA